MSQDGLSKPKNPKIAAALAFAGVVVPVAGFHKFYLGQPGWGVVYVVLSITPIARIASAVEGVWYLLQDRQAFDQHFNQLNSNPSAAATVATTVEPAADPAQISAIAEALRQLDQLRQEGLLSEYEFEQKRRRLLDKID
jgi:TM2 domain-containing membrane protein YozV